MGLFGEVGCGVEDCFFFYIRFPLVVVDVDFGCFDVGGCVRGVEVDCDVVVVGCLWCFVVELCGCGWVGFVDLERD